MEIVHDPSLDAREPREGDLEAFEGLEPGDSLKFFEWPVEPLTVLGWEDDESVGKRLRVEAEGSESFLYRVEDHLWHYVPEEQYDEANNPFPVQNLVLVEPQQA
ncbi:hypothetical protein [Haloplanus sp. C73]|uniref:hypothetical protein n=1 Tax=Haloplanus sp. C73 TaxID=3421641 RepID=UPI003EB73730